MQHFFDIDIAVKYGTDLAIFLKNLAYWISYNKAHKQNYHDGRYWTYNTVDSLAKLFPYWSNDQIRRIIRAGIGKGLILKGNYNEKQYDRTLWYSLTDEGLDLFNIFEESSISGNEEIHLAKSPNGCGETPKPIPNRNTDIKPNNKKRERANRAPAKRGTQIPVKYCPNEKHYQLAKDLGLDVMRECEKFSDYYQSRGKSMLDWDAAFRNWLRKAHDYAQAKPKQSNQGTDAFSRYQEKRRKELTQGRIIDADSGVSTTNWF